MKTFHYACPGDKDDPEITYTGYEDELGNITKHGRYLANIFTDQNHKISLNYKQGKLDGLGTINSSNITATLKYDTDKLISINCVGEWTGGGKLILNYSLGDNGCLKGAFELKEYSFYNRYQIKGQVDEKGRATGWFEINGNRQYYEQGYCLGSDDKIIETSRAYFIEKKLSEKELHDKGFYVKTDSVVEVSFKKLVDRLQKFLQEEYGVPMRVRCVDLKVENTINLDNVFKRSSIVESPLTYMSAELYQKILAQIKDNNLQTPIMYDSRLEKYYILKVDRETRLYIPVEAEDEFKEITGDKKEKISHNNESCGVVTDYDGNKYQTVKLGSQCWMKENLRSTHYADGTEIGKASRYNPNNDASKVSEYGFLYTWTAVMHGATSSNETPSNVQGICPNGWHVPSDAEWRLLDSYVRDKPQYLCNNEKAYIAKSLASTKGWGEGGNGETCKVGDNPQYNNATGFSALPAASYCSGNYTKYLEAFFWSTTGFSRPEGRKLSSGDYNLDRFTMNKSDAASVRCLRD